MERGREGKGGGGMGKGEAQQGLALLTWRGDSEGSQPGGWEGNCTITRNGTQRRQVLRGARRRPCLRADEASKPHTSIETLLGSPGQAG